MGCALRLYASNFLIVLMMLMMYCIPNELKAYSKDIYDIHSTYSCYKNITDQYDQDKDDDELIREIWGVGAMMYKSIIDMSALYFSGILLDTNQLYDRMMFDFGKNLFHIVKLLASYGPRMLQNPHISWKVKVKKTGYIVSFLVVFWIWSQEVSRQKQSKNIRTPDMCDMSLHRDPTLNNAHEEVLAHRPRPSAW